MTNKRVLWIDSDSSTTESYRDKLIDNKLSIEVVDNAYDAVLKLDTVYDAVFLNPFLNQGRRRSDLPDGSSDPYRFGLWTYEKILKSCNANKPIFLLYIGGRISHGREKLSELEKARKSTKLFCLLDDSIHNLEQIIKTKLKL